MFKQKKQESDPQITAGKHSRKFLSSLGYVLIMAGIGFGILALVLARQNQTPTPFDKLSAPDFTHGADSSGAPSQSDIDSYSVPSSHPKYIAIPAIAVPKSEVIALGLDQDHSIAIPSSSYVTGWYDASAKPGETGAMFIYGHVAGWYGGGIFYNLKKLKSGDNIIITRGDDKIYTYQVISSRTYPYNSVDMRAVLSPTTPGSPGLNLMSCTGKVIPGSKPLNFNERLVVFTKLVGTD
jgi:sortase (surface protein transpeptidase)